MRNLWTTLTRIWSVTLGKQRHSEPTRPSLRDRLAANNCINCYCHNSSTIPPCAINPLIEPGCKDWVGKPGGDAAKLIHGQPIDWL